MKKTKISFWGDFRDEKYKGSITLVGSLKKHLEEKIRYTFELEKIKGVMVDREIKMIKLKKEITSLKKIIEKNIGNSREGSN